MAVHASLQAGVEPGGRSAIGTRSARMVDLKQELAELLKLERRSVIAAADGRTSAQ